MSGYQLFCREVRQSHPHEKDWMRLCALKWAELDADTRSAFRCAHLARRRRQGERLADSLALLLVLYFFLFLYYVETTSGGGVDSEVEAGLCAVLDDLRSLREEMEGAALADQKMLVSKSVLSSDVRQ